MDIGLYSFCDRIEKKLCKEQRIAFLCTFFGGLVVHMYMLTNKFPNHDDIVCLFRNDATVTSGRWFLPVLIGISSEYSLPWLNGILALLYLSLLSVVLVRFFRIRRKLTVILCCLSMVSFPSVANAFGFMFTADGYMAAFLLSGIAAYLCDGERLRSFIASIVLLVLSVASYQATLSFFVAILTVRGLLYLFDRTADDLLIRKKLLRYTGCAIASALLYILSAKAALLITGKQMENYAGLQDLGRFSFSAIPGMITESWWGFFRFAFVTSGIQCGLWMSIAHLVFGLSAFVALVYRFQKSGNVSMFRKILFAAVMLFLPLLLNSAAFLGSTHIHIIMMFGISMVFWLGMSIAEELNDRPIVPGDRSSAFMRIIASVIPLSMILISFGWAVYSNQCYLKTQLKYENSYALANRIVDRIETFPGYTQGIRVAFIGEPALGSYPQAKDGALGSLGRDEGFGGPSEYSFIYDDRHLKDFMKYYLGVRYDLLDETETLVLSKDERIGSMPVYPAADSVMLLDNVLVVKLS